MRIGIVSTAYFTLKDYQSGMELMHSHGYDCIDFKELANMNSELYSLSEAEFRDFLTRIGTSARENGLEVWQMHGLWPTVNADKTEEDRQKTIELFKKEIEGAHYLGCRFLVIHPLMPFGTHSEGDGDFTFNENEKMLRSLIPYAERFSVTVCIENMPFTALSISSVSELKRLVNKINHPNIKICLDIGHANVLRESIDDDIRLLADDLATIHIHDNNGRYDTHSLPYFGTVDWDSFLSALGEIGFDGSFNLETSISNKLPEPYREQMRKTLAALARNMSEKVERLAHRQK